MISTDYLEDSRPSLFSNRKSARNFSELVVVTVQFSKPATSEGVLTHSAFGTRPDLDRLFFVEGLNADWPDALRCAAQLYSWLTLTLTP